MIPGSTRAAATALALSLGIATGACSSGGADDASRTRYTDGEYRATGWYGNLPSSIDVELTLADGVIADVEVTPHATDPTSRQLQERFAEAVPRRVIGRPIDEVRLTRLAGSSGTTLGFNDALERIKQDAAP